MIMTGWLCLLRPMPLKWPRVRGCCAKNMVDRQLLPTVGFAANNRESDRPELGPRFFLLHHGILKLECHSSRHPTQPTFPGVLESSPGKVGAAQIVLSNQPALTANYDLR